ncbi:anthranilate synthase component 1 [Sediminitomix flava]|uniref:Anthranilate synthase component 1 n=2 Tax=Sediminitomix flava TaxID=379075 RepID=A0A315ZV75_SEDFL|nr:anthranilate synthase component 1 [Sediminitomix flava]
MLADTITPVSLYLKLRDRFANSILLESSDYHGTENSFSYICADPMASFKVQNGDVEFSFPDGQKVNRQLEKPSDAVMHLNTFLNSFSDCSEQDLPEDKQGKFITNGLFGYMGFDAVQYYEDIKFENEDRDEIPQIYYNVYRYVIAIDHFHNELYILEHHYGEDKESRLDEIAELINSQNVPTFGFNRTGEETSNFEDKEFLEVLKKGKEHCYRGDVFQIVLSRRFATAFQGDEFNVYRALRSINPSPYLFYFDYGSFKIFGSSPEAQIVLNNQQATIYPIAGTFRRTGNDTADAELAQKLLEDPKENAEHVMLVDLARNDLSRNGEQVKVEVYKEIQYYSHVIHLVSKVSAKLTDETVPVQVVADTFPAGTLSGAPKYKAMELIDRYENGSRSYYGGAIGFMGFNGDFNHAIMIRSFLSKNNHLQYQAGAGVVAKSSEESELQEVHNKLAALRTAMNLAEKM